MQNNHRNKNDVNNNKSPNHTGCSTEVRWYSVDKKHVMAVKLIFYAWIISVVAAIGFGGFGTSLFAISYTGILPLIVTVVIFSGSEIRRRLESALTIWLVRAFWIIATSIFFLYAKKRAGDIVNEIFKVDPQYFSSLTTVVAATFWPFDTIYSKYLLGSLFNYLMASSMILVNLMPIMLVMPVRLSAVLKFSVYLLASACLGSFFIMSNYNLSERYKAVLKEYAIWADFNEHHLCKDQWASSENSVIFLNHGKVLSYFPNRKEGEKFSVESCDYAAKF